MQMCVSSHKLDLVGQTIKKAQESLNARDYKYIEYNTCPPRDKLRLGTDKYVIRQHIDAENIYHLVTALKMGKEVY